MTTSPSTASASWHEGSRPSSISRLARSRRASTLPSSTVGIRRPTTPSNDDAADDLARLHCAESVVDLVELDPARHHRTEVETPGLGESDEPGEVPAHTGRAVDAPQHLLLFVEQLERRER